MLYWTGGHWWGVGPGAHSHVGGTRWWNVKHPAAYASRLAEDSSPAQAREVLTDGERRFERVLLELRVEQGCPLDLLEPAGREAAARAVADGLLDADAHHADLYSWDGRCLDTRRIPPGVSVVVNTGLDPADPRAARHTPVFAAARPDPDLARARTLEEVWGAWPRLVNEAAADTPRSAGLDDAGDPSGLIAHADLGGGKVWATGSVTLLAVDRDTVRYAFTADPADPRAWTMVDTGPV